MKRLIPLLLLCAFVPLRAEAAALSFNVAPGGLNYDPLTQVFVANGTVTAVEQLSMDISGQLFRLSAALMGVDIDTSAGTFVAHFGTVPGADLEVPGLLAGEFASLLMVGSLGSDFGLLSGVVDLSGLLAPEFGAPAVLVSLQLNMSGPFDEQLLLNPFVASLDGQVIGAAVSEPSSAALIVSMLIGFIHFIRLNGVRRAVRLKSIHRSCQ